MTVKLINRNTTGEFLLEGRLDTNSATEVEKLVFGNLERFDNVILNFSGLTYISSAGLRFVKMLYMALKKKNGELVLKNVSQTVMEIFEMTGFAQILTFE